MNSDLTTKLLSGFYIYDIASLLSGSENFGVELGIAEGIFSERMVKSGKFSNFIGIDMYADAHDVHQYKRALKRVGLSADYKLLRMRFDEAIDLFDNESLDFIYVDGYAHGGEEGGETIFEWYRKVKVGGLIAGDDYHSDWPLVCEAVNEFARQLGEPILLTEIIEQEGQYCRYPTWAVRKTKQLQLQAPRDLIRRGKREVARIAIKNEGGILIRALKRTLPPSVLEQIKKMRRAVSGN